MRRLCEELVAIYLGERDASRTAHVALSNLGELGRRTHDDLQRDDQLSPELLAEIALDCMRAQPSPGWIFDGFPSNAK